MSELTPFAVDTELRYTEPPVPGWKYGQMADATPEGKEWVKRTDAGFKFVDTTLTSP